MPAPALACSIANAALIAISRATALRAARSSRRVFGRAEAVMVSSYNTPVTPFSGAVTHWWWGPTASFSFSQDLGLAAIGWRRPSNGGRGVILARCWTSPNSPSVRRVVGSARAARRTATRRWSRCRRRRRGSRSPRRTDPRSKPRSRAGWCPTTSSRSRRGARATARRPCSACTRSRRTRASSEAAARRRCSLFRRCIGSRIPEPPPRSRGSRTAASSRRARRASPPSPRRRRSTPPRTTRTRGSAGRC